MDPGSKPRPNLFVVGAMKSGTTSFHSWLSGHPAVFMSPVKEPCYFVSAGELDWPKIRRLRLWEDEAKYLALFEKAGAAEVIGESSTLYTRAPRYSGIPRRIHRFAPEAKILYLMRDPVERTVSHYWHEVRLHQETRSPLRAVREEPHYLHVSYYAYQIRPYLELFPSEQVLPVTWEELRDSRPEALGRIARWLGIDPGAWPDVAFHAENVTPRRVHRIRGSGRLYRLRMSRAGRWLSRCAPGAVRPFLRQATESVVDRRSVDLTPLIDYLRPQQLQETHELEALLGRRFPHWRTLVGDSPETDLPPRASIGFQGEPEPGGDDAAR